MVTIRNYEMKNLWIQKVAKDRLLSILVLLLEDIFIGWRSNRFIRCRDALP